MQHILEIIEFDKNTGEEKDMNAEEKTAKRFLVAET